MNGLYSDNLQKYIGILGNFVSWKFLYNMMYTVNNYRQVTGMVTGENFAFFIYRHFVEIL